MQPQPASELSPAAATAVNPAPAPVAGCAAAPRCTPRPMLMLKLLSMPCTTPVPALDDDDGSHGMTGKLERYVSAMRE